MLRFTAIGVPQQKGSTRAFIPKGWKRPIITSDNPKNKGWQQIVADAAAEAMQRTPTFRPIETAARLQVIFYMPRPKTIRDRMPAHTKRPDLDKLVRSVKDALSKVAWRDDALVVELAARKEYARPTDAPRADICISTFEEFHQRKAG